MTTRHNMLAASPGRPHSRAARTSRSRRRLVASASFVLAVVLGCVAASPGAARPTSVDDTVLFTAAVQSMMAEHQTRLRVDPRPLHADSVASNEDYLRFAEPSVADTRPDVAKARSAALRRLGVPEADAVAASRCPGVEAILSAAEAAQRCPFGRELVAILGLARRSGAVRPSPDSTDLGGGGRQGYWVMRALEMHLNQHSRATIVADYTMGWKAGGWTVVKKEPLFILE
jgi:hypothetical protein